MKQNTRPRRRDVLLRVTHVPKPRRATSWSGLRARRGGGRPHGAGGGDGAARQPFRHLPAADDSVSGTYTVGSIFPTSCSPQSSRHSPRPRQGRRFGVFVSSSFSASTKGHPPTRRQAQRDRGETAGTLRHGERQARPAKQKETSVGAHPVEAPPPPPRAAAAAAARDAAPASGIEAFSWPRIHRSRQRRMLQRPRSRATSRALY